MRLLRALHLIVALFTITESALLGIDYGQDFLKSTLIAPGIPFEIVLTSETKRKEPSSIALKQIPGSKHEFERFYGAASTSVCSRYPETCITNLKALLGQPFSNKSLIETYTSNHPGVSPIENKKRQIIDFEVARGAVYQVEEINAMILSHIKDRAQKMLKQETGSSYLSDATLTVPSYFTQAQRLALINSAKIAGFTDVKLVDDGLAVAVNYASNNIKFEGTGKQHHLVFDMGAGSTKATLFSFNADEKGSVTDIEVKGYGADESLGGELFTSKVFDLLKAKFIDKNPSVSQSSLAKNKKAIVKLWQAAEKTKLVLSANNEASASVESFYDGIDFKAVVTREEFELENEKLSSRIAEPILNALAQSEFDLEKLDSVLLFGGSTRVPFVQKELTKILGKDLISKNVNADEAAVQGAALRGVVLSKMFRAKEINITEKFIYDYGIELSTESSKEPTRIPVFAKNTPVENIAKIELPDLHNQETNFEISLLENGNSFETNSYKAVKNNIKLAVEKLSKDFDLSTCKKNSGLHYYAFVNFDESKIFSIQNITAVCVTESDGNKGFFQNILKGKNENNEDAVVEEEELANDDERNTNSTSSTEKASGSAKPKTTIKLKNLKAALTSVKDYPSVKPLSTIQRDTSQRKLRDLSLKDHVRIQKSELLNTLESELYSIRSSIDDSEDDIKEGAASGKFQQSDLRSLQAFKKLVGEYLEWLEDQTYNLKDVNTSEINKRIEVLNIISKYLENPIRADSFSKVVSESNKISTELEDISTLLEIEAEKVAKTYLQKNVTREAFDKDNQKVAKTSLLKIEELNIEKELLNLSETIQKLHEAIKRLESDANNKVNKDDEVSSSEAEEVVARFELITSTQAKLQELQKLSAKVKKEQKRRLKLLEKLLDNRLKKRKEKAEKLENLKTDEKTDQESSKKTTDGSTTNSDSAVHDEL